MAVCEHRKRSASLIVRGLRVEGDIIGEDGGSEEEAATEVMLAILLCIGRNTIGCCRCPGGVEL